jgi:uncharacterized protein
MAIVTKPQPSVPAARPAGAREAAPARVATGALATEAVGFAVLLGASGSPGWRAVRVAAVITVGAVTLLVERQRGRVARGATALAVGLVGLTTGAGIGVMHLVKSDLNVQALGGLVILATGLVLLAVGAARLWRATPGWWRLLALPFAFVVVEFAVIPVTAATYGTNLPATRLAKATPADHGFPYQDITLVTSDHVRLSGWYISSRNGASVVLLHGSGSTRSSVLAQAAVLARHGYGVLLFDARGHGRSGGTGMDFGWWGDRDIGAAVTWLASRPDVTGGRIAAVGMSMGGEEAIGAAATDQRVRAVVTEGALWRGSQDTGWLPTNLSGVVERGMLAVQTAVTGALTDAPQPLSLHQAISEIAPRPVLLIAGKPELRGDRYLRDAAPGTVELWELPDTPHVSGLAYHPAEWEARVTGFLDRALSPPQP